MNYFILQHFKPPCICSNTAFVLPTTFLKNVSKLWVATFGRVLKHWSRLSREAVESPFMEIFKTQLGTALTLYLLCAEGLACIRCRDDFQLQLFCDSVIQALVAPEITRGLMLYNFTKFLSWWIQRLFFPAKLMPCNPVGIGGNKAWRLQPRISIETMTMTDQCNYV